MLNPTGQKSHHTHPIPYRHTLNPFPSLIHMVTAHTHTQTHIHTHTGPRWSPSYTPIPSPTLSPHTPNTLSRPLCKRTGLWHSGTLTNTVAQRLPCPVCHSPVLTKGRWARQRGTFQRQIQSWFTVCLTVMCLVTFSSMGRVLSWTKLSPTLESNQ